MLVADDHTTIPVNLRSVSIIVINSSTEFSIHYMAVISTHLHNTITLLHKFT